MKERDRKLIKVYEYEGDYDDVCEHSGADVIRTRFIELVDEEQHLCRLLKGKEWESVNGSLLLPSDKILNKKLFTKKDDVEMAIAKTNEWVVVDDNGRKIGQLETPHNCKSHESVAESTHIKWHSDNWKDAERVIRVGKQCIINQAAQPNCMNYSDILVNVSATDDKSGFVQYFYSYEDNQQCCEEWGTKIKRKRHWNNDFENVTAAEIDELFNKRIFVEYIFADYNGCIIQLQSGEEWNFRFYNEHNGYYSHSIEYRWTESGMKPVVVTDSI